MANIYILSDGNRVKAYPHLHTAAFINHLEKVAKQIIRNVA